MITRKKILLLGDINSIHLQKWILGLKSNYDLTVFSLDPLEVETEKLNGIALLTNSEKTTNKSSKLFYLKSIRYFRKLHKEIKPDFVHSHYATSYGLLGALLNPKSFYISVWGSDVYEFPQKSMIHKFVLKRLLNRATKLFSTSENMKLELQNYTSKEILVIPFGVNLADYKKIILKKPSKEFVVGTVKTLEKVYGIDRLIMSFAKFNNDFPQSKCIIYGKGTQEAYLRKMAMDLNISDKVEFKGFINHSDVPNAISKMDVFCILSRRESFGVSALEAAACGVPVIGANVGGIPEVIIDGKTGYLVDDIEMAYEKMIFLASNPLIREKMSINAKQMVEQKYDWNKSVELMIRHY